MLDGVLDPMYPYDPQFQCDRCDRGVDKMDERSVLRLLFYPSVASSHLLVIWFVSIVGLCRSAME